LRILFADEARFGRINRPRPCWAPIGIRPEVASQLIREYIYLYGAVFPKDGLIMPRSDTACFQVLLNALSRKFTRQDKVLVPELRPGDIVVLDNLSSHKGEAINAAIEASGATMMFLPPYSPDLNPIELMFSKLKTLLRKAAERTVDALWNRIGELLDHFTPQECANFFRHAGYNQT
jgi:transposase